jgi:hypothetical protein
VPSKVQAAGGVGLTAPGGVAAAWRARSASVARGPDGWLTTPSAIASSATGSFHCSDAAPSNWARAVAAASRSTGYRSVMLDDPPVALMPISRTALASSQRDTRSARLSAPGSLSSGLKYSTESTDADTLP